MISKNNAKAIWSFYTGATTTLSLDGITVGTYFNPDHDNEPEKDTLAGYVQNSAIQWFVKFINGTSLTNGLTSRNIVEYLTGTNSGLTFSINKNTGKVTFDIKLAGLSATGYITCLITGTDAAYMPTISPVTTSASTCVIYELNDDFYRLYKAQNGLGPTTIENEYGINTDMYYIASYVNYVEPTSTEMGHYNDITYTNQAIFFAQNSNDIVAYMVDSNGIITQCESYEFDITHTVLTINNSIVYDVYGDTYKVIVAR